jgi:uroporphyrinogen-III synthase
MEYRPLEGRKVVVTRSREQAASFCARLEAEGAIPVVFPTIQFVPLESERLDRSLSDLARYAWVVFTSGTAVDVFFRQLEARTGEQPTMPKIAAVGPSTARRLKAHGHRADFVPEQYTGEQLASELELTRGDGVLLPRSKIGRPEVVARLEARGVIVDDVAIYDTVAYQPSEWDLTKLSAGFDVLTFTSPSSVWNFLDAVRGQRAAAQDESIGAELEAAVIACIGPTTAEAARRLGLNVDVVADPHTVNGLLEGLANYFVAGG